MKTWHDRKAAACLAVSASSASTTPRNSRIGTNRWSIKPELGLSKAFGPLTVELAAGVSLYTDNHDVFRRPAPRAASHLLPPGTRPPTTFALGIMGGSERDLLHGRAHHHRRRGGQ